MSERDGAGLETRGHGGNRGLRNTRPCRGAVRWNENDVGPGDPTYERRIFEACKMGKPGAGSMEMEVLCGPAGSGKTRAAVERYAKQVQDGGEDTALLILPTARVVRQVRAGLVEEGWVKGLVDPRVFTFPQLAEVILNANRECATAIDATQQSLLLREVTQHLVQAGELTELAEASALPGFTAALADLIGELKRAAIEPKGFCQAMADAGLDEPRHREVGRLYCAYQWLLICLRYFDEEGLFWWAREVLGRGRRRPLTRVQLMVVDGFTDFTTTQLEMLGLLAEGIPQTLITLDHVGDDPRGGLGAWLRDTLERLGDRWPQAQLTSLPAPDDAGALAHLRANLFVQGEAVQPVSGQDKVHILSCPGRSREVGEVLRRVKGLLVSGRARPGDIGIIARSLAERAQTVRELASRMGVPVHIEGPRSPLSSPAVQTVLLAYDTVDGGYRRADVLRLLRSSYLAWERLVESPDCTAEDVALVSAEAKIIQGGEQWMERLTRHRERCERRAARSRTSETPQGELIEEELARAKAVEELMPRIFELLPDPDPNISLAERVAETRSFIERTRLWENVGRAELASHSSWDMRALELLGAGVEKLEHVRQEGLPGEKMPAGAYRALLREVLDAESETPPVPAGDRVTVIDARRARQLRFRFCFVMGLTEGEFPQQPAEEPFFTPAELRKLAGHGVVVERRRTPEADEPVLFYGAVCAATEELRLSYPATDADGKSLQASHYVQEVRRCFEAGTIDEQPISPSNVLPEPADLTHEAELVERAFYDLGEGSGEGLPLAYNALRRHRAGSDLIPRVASGVRIEEERDSPQGGGIYSGRLTGSVILSDLQERFGPEYRFSDTQLTLYAGCPFSFFCERVLGLREAVAPVPDVDPRDLGTVYHRVLSLFARSRMEREPGAPLVPPGEEERAIDELHAIADEEFARFAAREGVAEPVLWDIERLRCRENMATWVSQEVEAFADQVPLACEVRFGRWDAQPVALPGHDDILLQGRIDRVNVEQANGVGPGDPTYRTAERRPGRFVLVDYKLGDSPSGKAIERGEDLQFPIYTIGATQGVPELAGAECSGWRYWRLAKPLGLKKVGEADKIAEIVPSLVPVIAGHVSGIRSGAFSSDQVEKCARYCGYSDVCRHKPWLRREEDNGADTDGSA